MAYHPVIDILKSIFNILDGDDCIKIRDKVTQMLKTIGLDESAILPYVLELLSVKDSGIDKIDMSPEARKNRIKSAVRQITLKGAEIQPLIIAVEDLHWIDRNSEEYLKTLLESISGARIFLIFTCRPEYVHTWGGKSYHSQINLNRLSNRESLAMVAHLLGTDKVDSQIEELVLEKTEGVPFYIEEFIKSLKDLKVIETTQKTYHLVKDIKHVVIPSTIHEVIMSRVDSLPEAAKDLLQIGSAIEREYSYELIKRVSELPEKELLSSLSVLKDSELIYERGIYPQSTYIFKHALTQEVVYDSILGKRKKKLHEKIGSAIEELHKDNIDEHYAALTDHFIKAENYEKGDKYCKMTCRNAQKKGSLKDAIAFSKKRIECLEKSPQTEDVQKKIIDARAELCLYLMQMSFYVELQEVVAPVYNLALKNNYKKRLCQIYIAQGAYNCMAIENLTEAFLCLEKGIDASEEVGDFISLILAHMQLGFAMAFNCEFDDALKHFQVAIDIISLGNSKWGLAIAKKTPSFFVYNIQGKIELAFTTSEDALKLANESGDILSKAETLIGHGLSCYSKRLLTDAEKFLSEGSNLCERIDLIGWNPVAQFVLGETFYELGDYPKSKLYYSKAISQMEMSRFQPSLMNVYKIALLRSRMMAKEVDINLKPIYKYISENKFKIYEGWIRRYLGEILLYINENHFSEADEWIKEAIQADQRNGMMFHLAKDYALYADLFKRKADILKAKENLTKAIELFKECGADGWVEKYEKELTTI